MMRKLDLTTTSILLNWSYGKQPQTVELEELIKKELADKTQARAFGINQNNSQQLIEARSQLFCSAYSPVMEWCHLHQIEDKGNNILSLMWNLWLPLAVNLAELRQKLGRTPIQGISGGLGTGKSSLVSILNLLLSHLGYQTISLSLEDISKTYTERFSLKKTDPRLIWHDLPGTHDIYLGLQVLENCRQKVIAQEILIPRFDKFAHHGAGDRVKPEAMTQADIVLFEGWFVGVRPLEETMFEYLLKRVPNLEDIRFAQDNNERLRAYVPLWEKLDSLLVLYPLDYHFSKEWSKQDELNMIPSGKTRMSELASENFIDYCWRALPPELFINPLLKQSDLVDLVIEVKQNHNYGQIYKPN